MKNFRYLTLWTYGGTPLGNPGPGGWSYILRDGVRVDTDSGHEPATTNNRMELRAAIVGVSRTPAGSAVTVYSDSQYVVSGASNGIHKWKRKGWRNSAREPVANLDLWKELVALISCRNVEWKWVRQGDGGCDHQACIDAAKRAARMANERTPQPYGTGPLSWYGAPLLPRANSLRAEANPSA